MKSFTNLRNLYGTLTLDASATNLTLGDQLINDEIRHICALQDFPWTHKARTMTTTASTQFKALPFDIDLVESVFVTVSSQRYVPKLIHSREQWDILNRSNYTSDYPEYALVYNGELGLWPIPATSSNVITVNGKLRVIDLNTADDTARTITTLANGSNALTVSAGLTAQHPGFFIRPTFSTTANTGDGNWYEIATVTGATTGTLVRLYGGNSIAAGTAACTISQMPILPEDFHDLPVFKAAETYWNMEGNFVKAATFAKAYSEGLQTLVNQYKSPISDLVIDDGSREDFINPNILISI